MVWSARASTNGVIPSSSPPTASDFSTSANSSQLGSFSEPPFPELADPDINPNPRRETNRGNELIDISGSSSGRPRLKRDPEPPECLEEFPEQ
mmetsp:Transcript_51407/g.104610  ORF Transcript_51407/g.104610 Transcript_51407/m.104610 type:complete len:93 (-) Transcript_51407:167-445(-)